MQLIRAIPLTAESYFARNYHRRISRPSNCTHCGTPRSLAALGYYSRNITNSGHNVLRIPIRRFRCLRCGRTISILPSFAQPYRLIESAIIHRFFNKEPDPGALSWTPLLRQYWLRFIKWIPEIGRVVGALTSRSPPHRDGVEWWDLLGTVFGHLAKITREFVSRFKITLFGRYRCHSPGLRPAA